MRNIVITLTLGLFFLACKPASNSTTAQTTEQTTEPAKVKIPEGPLAKKLYVNYHSAPTTQNQIDENRLIEYAVANNIDVDKTASGLYYSIEKTNESENYTKCAAQPCPKIKAHYRGTTLDGKEFDSSYKRNSPIEFMHGQMIPGWNEALLMMNPGSKGTLLIPSHLAYGKRGFPGSIGPNEPLVFTLETLAN